MSWKLTMNRLLSQDRSFCITDKKWVYWVSIWKFSTFGDFSTDVEWLNTSVVYSSHNRTSQWVESLTWIYCSGNSSHFFCNRQKMTSLAWTIYSWYVFNSLGCPLMIRTNYRCIESFNNSVEVAKCGKYSQIHPVNILFDCYKKWLVLPEQSIHGKHSTH